MIIKHADLTFLCEDHPEANNRVPLYGEQEYNLYFVLENHKTLCVKMGKLGYRIFHDFIRQMAIDDVIDEVLEK